MLNRIFFLRKQLFLVFLIFLSVFVFGFQDAYGAEPDESLEGAVEAASPPPPRIVQFIGLPADTKLDYRWERIEAPTAATKQLWAGRFNGATADAMMEQVNTWVNTRIQHVDDVDDDWSSANRTLARGTGDCEDVAITKYQILKSLGFPEENMYLVIATDGVARQDHAFLLIHSAGRNLILDNLTNMLIPDTMVLRTYYPRFAYGKNGSWVFGIKKTN